MTDARDRRPDREPSASEPGRSGVVRQTVEFLIVVLCLGILLFRTFAAEAYIVPTGSMAPTLLGHHRELTCPNCELRLRHRARRGGPVRRGRSARTAARTTSSSVAGRRVQRRPRPGPEVPLRLPPPQALGGRRLPLPGRADPGVRQAGGGPARRVDPDRRGATSTSTARSRGRRSPSSGRCASWSTTTTSSPRDSDRFPRWVFRQGSAAASGSPAAGSRGGRRFVHEPTEPASAADRIDWLDYRHWDPDRGRYGPVRDFIRLQRRRPAGRERRHRPDARGATVARRRTSRRSSLRIDSGGDRFLVAIPVDGRGELEVARNGRRPPIVPRPSPLAERRPPWPRRVVRLEVVGRWTAG